ncbi:MAG: hypothetical protein RBT40_03715 [Petrimonas sp.]|jgi:hypothetical protein|uniref:hypothetical protein n=1 Tax=Petrimonas sp. TaxID=2023866 RepID=UPI002A49D60B|nr:hypothetical protein [Petrimonas sp.]
MEIYKDNYPISRSICLSLLDNVLTLESYDSGDGFSEERIITLYDLSAIKKAMNVETDEDLLEKIKISYSKSDAVDSFSNFLGKNKIKFQYHRFTN